MIASDIMRSSIATIKPETRLLSAARLLLETNQRALPVVDKGGHLIGTVSERDLVRIFESRAATMQRTSWLKIDIGADMNVNPQTLTDNITELTAAHVMTSPPVCVGHEASIDDVVALMDDRRIGQLPVLRGDILVGMISRIELLQLIERTLTKAIEEHNEQ